ncbi:hypothetical protein DSO57_1032067 [Entomophthora muscae]|uniref:Uncharacterized protein n=1 Tax=Entomophthora muscae TaxID=34485 RepID=A0ACC2SPW3_9FUNG|nr:hypothetical protein DSO57_1032067 [Entomophthora muscae]
MSRIIPGLPSVKDIVKIYNLTAKSQLSQNFLLDKNITDKILSLSRLNFEKSLVVEVGPGPGLLTRSIIEAGAKNLIVVEKDDRFLPTLNQLSEVVEGSLKIVHGDMLKVAPETLWDLSSIAKEKIESVHVIGNLPFSVATPLFLQWLRAFHTRTGLFSQGSGTLTLMFQEEVAERIASPPGVKSRGRLSVMAQSVCDSRVIYRVPSSAFVPKPKVDNVFNLLNHFR